MTFYELNFHDYFDGLIGSETLSELDAILYYKKAILRMNNQDFQISKHFISEKKKNSTTLFQLQLTKMATGS
jgi:hypothetical protein